MKKRAAKHDKPLPDHAVAVRQLREAVKLTRAALGIKLRVKGHTVSRWESGEREPGKWNYRALSEFAQQKDQQQLAKFFQSKTEEIKVPFRDRNAERALCQIRARAGAGDKTARDLLNLAQGPQGPRDEYIEKKAAAALPTYALEDSRLIVAIASDINEEAELIDQLRRGLESERTKSSMGKGGRESHTEVPSTWDRIYRIVEGRLGPLKAQAQGTAILKGALAKAAQGKPVDASRVFTKIISRVGQWPDVLRENIERLERKLRESREASEKGTAVLKRALTQAAEGKAVDAGKVFSKIAAVISMPPHG